MLVLSRKVGEAILIGNEISVAVLRVRGHGVSLGITAPKEVSVRRTGQPSQTAPCLARKPSADLAETHCEC